MNRTAQREAILSELRASRNHPTAEELYTVLRSRMPQLSLGTVYRNLEQMSQAGVIRKLETAGKRKRFDGDLSLHHHLRCIECGAVEDIVPAALREVDVALARLLPQLECVGYNLELNGRCRCCREKDTAEISNKE